MSKVFTTSDHSRGLKSYYGNSNRHQYAQSPKQQKARSGNELLGLSRCAACYNHNASATHWRGGNGESSSSAEDSGSEVDCESEAESSSSSSCSGHAAAVAAAPEKAETEKLSTVFGDPVEPKCGGQDNTLQSQEDKIRTNGTTQRAPLVKSFSLPSSLTPHPTPFSPLPRPPRIVSTLHLQVLPEKHQGDTFFTIRQHLCERQHENTEQSYEGEERMNTLLPPQPLQWQQMGLPQPTLQQHQYPQQQQQQQTSHQFQQLPQYFPPHSAQDQMLAPPPTPLPVLQPLTLHTLLQAQHAPQTHLHALSPQPCWYCYQMHFPYTYWNHYSSGELPRW